MKTPALICMLMAKVYKGNTWHTSMADTGARCERERRGAKDKRRVAGCGLGRVSDLQTCRS